MKNDTESDGQEPIAQARPGDSESAPKTSRRRFGKAGLAAPVIMTLASRPVWATGRQCTVSALASANPSRPVDESTCQACSPGYWHHSNACWPAGYSRGTRFYQQFGYDLPYYQDHETAGTSVEGQRPGYAEIVALLDSPLNDFFPEGGSSALRKAMRAFLAAMLNADHPHVPFALSAADVRSSFDAVFPQIPPYDPATPTAKNSELNSLAESFGTNWDESSIECILPNSGDCP